MMKTTLPALLLACLLTSPLPASAQPAFEAALQAAREGRVAEALEAVDEALASDPGSVSALFTRGVILAENGRRGEAAEAFRRLIDGHPDLPEAYNNLAVLQAAEGDFDGAVATLKNALATNASYQTAYENLTRIFAQLASEAYSRALDVDSPPAREEVELEMLAELSAPFEAAPPAGAAVAAATTTPLPPLPAAPAEPMPAAPAEPMTEPAAAAESSVAGGATTPSAPTGVEGEDLEMAEMDRQPGAERAAAAGDLAGLVDEWARAWSEQRIDDYLAFYASDFVPANGMSRGDWEAVRRERIGAPEFINVEVAILDSQSDSDRASVTFLQAYESDTYSDQVTKTLTLVRRGAAWKIVAENSGS